MSTRTQDTGAGSKSVRPKHLLLPLLMVVAAGALVLAGCSSGGTVTSVTTATTQAGQTATTQTGQTATSATAAPTTTSTTAATTASTESAAEREADLFSPAQQVLSAVYSSVVNIAVTATIGGQTGTGIGSGVVYTSDGLILTNDHVVTLDSSVTSGQTIMVTFSDDSQIAATIVGEDATHDVAAIKVDKNGSQTDHVCYDRTHAARGMGHRHREPP